MQSNVARASEKESPVFRHGENVNKMQGERPTTYDEFLEMYGKRPPDIIFSLTRTITLQDIGDWLSSNPHLLSPIELQTLKQGRIPIENKGILATNLPKQLNPTIREGIGKVLIEIDKLRDYGYRLPKRDAEAASIKRMLINGYTPQQIIQTWQTLKEDIFWQGKELYLMSVEKQIGAMVCQSKPISRDDPDKYIKGKYGHMVNR